jgi:hypothetical protein
MKVYVPLVYIGYLALGVLQIAAVIGGIKYWLGVGSFFAFILAMFFGFVPIVGTALGVVGAHYSWGWSWLISLVLFFGFLVVIGILAAATGVVGSLSSKRSI